MEQTALVDWVAIKQKCTHEKTKIEYILIQLGIHLWWFDGQTDLNIKDDVFVDVWLLAYWASFYLAQCIFML